MALKVDVLAGHCSDVEVVRKDQWPNSSIHLEVWDKISAGKLVAGQVSLKQFSSQGTADGIFNPLI